MATGSFSAVLPVARGAVALAVAVATLFLAPGGAMAHTELEFSLPANGTTVGEPVAEISVGFTDMVALVGNGFEVHDPQGNLLTPFVVTDDDKVFRFQLDPPLAGGVVVVDYHIRALDGDVQEGSFTFTVAAPLPPSTTAPTTILPAMTVPATTASSAPATTITTQAAAAEPATTAPGTAVASALPTDDSDGDRERTVMLVVLLAIAAVSAGFLVVRSRRPA